MSRDIRWSKNNYFKWSQSQDDIDDEEVANTMEQIEMETEGDNAAQTTIVFTEVIEDDNAVAEALLSTNVASRPPSKNVKLIRAMSKLESFYNPDASKVKTIATHPERRVTRAQAINTAFIDQEGRYNDQDNPDEEIGSVAMDRNIHHLFGDITLFIKDTMLRMVETKEARMQLQENSVDLQRLDDGGVGQLDWLTGVEIQYFAPLSLCYSFTVAQVTVKGSTRFVSLVTFSLRFNW
jgi:hypothetical protein